MRGDDQFMCDNEFIKLMARRNDADLTRAALEIARDAYPTLDFQPTLDWIEERGSELAGPVAGSKSERAALTLLSHSLSETCGIFGDLACYQCPDSSYLNRVIETRRGLPITLSVLYEAVARAAGMMLRGVSSPQHFLLRSETSEGPLYLDPFSHGRIMTREETVAFLREMTQTPIGQIRQSLKPVGTRTIIIRMLNNLKCLHVEQERWEAAWIVQHRLAALLPASYQEQRDLALISLKAGRCGQAISLFESCLQAAPKQEASLLEKHLQHARVQLSRWN